MKFYKILFLAFFWILLTSNSTVENNHKCTYVLYSTKIIKKGKQESNKNIPNNIVKQMNEAYDIGKTFESELLCTNQRSIYKPIEKLQTENSISNKLANILFKANLWYKDLASNEKIEQVELGGEILNITMPIDYYKWNITTESKDISGYKCYKATAQWVDIDKIRNRETTRNAVAWFAPSIPCPFGPNGIDGLPGLVLEGSKDGVNFCFATKIIFDYETKIEIEKPKKGKTITIEEYPDLILQDFNSRK